MVSGPGKKDLCNLCQRKSRRTRSLFFIHFYPKVKEGAIVNVPTRPQGAEITDTLLQVVVSSIPIALAAFIVNSLR
ncbi:MAG: hypothetical protein IPO42_11015 [Chitinophagaceae bacterium]|nr:hypothetical protein [Chitinophagaceae bacterium]